MKKLIGTIKADGMPGRCKLYAEKQDDRWQIVALNPAGEIEDTEISAETFRGVHRHRSPRLATSRMGF